MSSIWYICDGVFALICIGGIICKSSSTESFPSGVFGDSSKIFLAIEATFSPTDSLTLSFFFLDESNLFCFAEPKASTNVSVYTEVNRKNNEIIIKASTNVWVYTEVNRTNNEIIIKASTNVSVYTEVNRKNNEIIIKASTNVSVYTEVNRKNNEIIIKASTNVSVYTEVNRKTN